MSNIKSNRVRKISLHQNWANFVDESETWFSLDRKQWPVATIGKHRKWFLFGYFYIFLKLPWKNIFYERIIIFSLLILFLFLSPLVIFLSFPNHHYFKEPKNSKAESVWNLHCSIDNLHFEVPQASSDKLNKFAFPKIVLSIHWDCPQTFFHGSSYVVANNWRYILYFYSDKLLFQWFSHWLLMKR